jgi:hypothetical protein
MDDNGGPQEAGANALPPVVTFERNEERSVPRWVWPVVRAISKLSGRVDNSESDHFNKKKWIIKATIYDEIKIGQEARTETVAKIDSALELYGVRSTDGREIHGVLSLDFIEANLPRLANKIEETPINVVLPNRTTLNVVGVVDIGCLCEAQSTRVSVTSSRKRLLCLVVNDTEMDYDLTIGDCGIDKVKFRYGRRVLFGMGRARMYETPEPIKSQYL